MVASENRGKGAGIAESRREALKKFGRYAAVAPTTVLLLDPRSASAFDDYTPDWAPGPPPTGPRPNPAPKKRRKRRR